MYQQNYNVGSAEPSAFITVKKQRQKQNGKYVYLHDKTEFEIELYNPTSETILAKINLNDQSISTSGIVLKPGQRVFLERYLDWDRKFLFETYEVKDNQTNQNAIKNNGLVTVMFMKKWKHNIFGGYTYLSNLPLLYTNGSGNVVPNNFTTTCLGNPNIVGTTSTSTANIETGRIEQGDASNQKFENNYEQFDVYPSWTREWKILPYSQKDKTTKDLVVKCACGTKMKDNYKFCPNCGKQKARTKTEIHYTMDVNVVIDNKRYLMSTYNETLVDFLERHKNKLIYIKSDSLTENSLRAIVID